MQIIPMITSIFFIGLFIFIIILHGKRSMKIHQQLDELRIEIDNAKTLEEINIATKKLNRVNFMHYAHLKRFHYLSGILMGKLISLNSDDFIRSHE